MFYDIILLNTLSYGKVMNQQMKRNYYREIFCQKQSERLRSDGQCNSDIYIPWLSQIQPLSAASQIQ